MIRTVGAWLKRRDLALLPGVAGLVFLVALMFIAAHWAGGWVLAALAVFVGWWALKNDKSPH